MRLGSKELGSFLGDKKEMATLYRLLEIDVKNRCGDRGGIRLEEGKVIFSDGGDYLWVSIPLQLGTYNPLPALLVTILSPFQIKARRIAGSFCLDRALWSQDVVVSCPEDIDEWLLGIIDKSHRFVLCGRGARLS